MPQSAEKSPNPTIALTKTRSAPNRPASQPVKGTVIASATAYDVITQRPWLLE